MSGNYSVPFAKIKVKDAMCLQCHISHGEQVDYCSSCHENGGQRMIEDPVEAGQREVQGVAHIGAVGFTDLSPATPAGV